MVVKLALRIREETVLSGILAGKTGLVKAHPTKINIYTKQNGI
jgi:hypothetical protein